MSIGTSLKQLQSVGLSSINSRGRKIDDPRFKGILPLPISVAGTDYSSVFLSGVGSVVAGQGPLANPMLYITIKAPVSSSSSSSSKSSSATTASSQASATSSTSTTTSTLTTSFSDGVVMQRGIPIWRRVVDWDGPVGQRETEFRSLSYVSLSIAHVRGAWVLTDTQCTDC